MGLIVLFGIIILFKSKSQTKIEVLTQKPTTSMKNTAINPTAIPVPSGTLFVTSDGLSPHTIEVKVGNALIVKNNTAKEVTIKTSGLMSSDITVGPGKTTNTQVFGKSGEFTSWLSNDTNNKVSITIK